MCLIHLGDQLLDVADLLLLPCLEVGLTLRGFRLSEVGVRDPGDELELLLLIGSLVFSAFLLPH